MAKLFPKGTKYYLMKNTMFLKYMYMEENATDTGEEGT
jgi:hypothetical protein